MTARLGLGLVAEIEERAEEPFQRVAHTVVAIAIGRLVRRGALGEGNAARGREATRGSFDAIFDDHGGIAVLQIGRRQRSGHLHRLREHDVENHLYVR